ncbi:ATP-dependent dethiobiotin synthetase BioD [Candidatus Fokinia solitaria]|uniref:ATP-dependent dethiobiotin synthetase BioD n=1 Tax=Candidatus Fokinia solitaria TaxID=1802984 RepID=A0A2U8BS29_9RICK|nr:dethiobiotin synthase [Candidatus Fokinia solitaria]AWD33113.1 ATP-dependent dethiobiotin synthetase BioD [Candidatus Fokinia solitaria]
MKVFICGTDTDIGKTVISSWLTLHMDATYFKPIQTGISEGNTDSMTVKNLSQGKIHQEKFVYKKALSPHLAAKLENERIDIDKIILPQEENLIVEGAGGLLVPINDEYLMIDLIKKLNISVIIVTSAKLGTINHTLLCIEALRTRKIDILGVIMNGEDKNENMEAIEFYGKTQVIAQFPYLSKISYNTLKDIPLPERLVKILRDTQ